MPSLKSLGFEIDTNESREAAVTILHELQKYQADSERTTVVYDYHRLYDASDRSRGYRIRNGAITKVEVKSGAVLRTNLTNPVRLTQGFNLTFWEKDRYAIY